VGRRSEQRIVILIPVIVRGRDARGNPFELPAETCDISDSGGRLRGLSAVAVPRQKIEVECRDKKAWYRIQWVGQARTLNAGQFGIHLLEPGKNIWGIPSKKWALDKFDPSQLATFDRGSLPGDSGTVLEMPHAGEERRRFRGNRIALKHR
jgi:hypothetical protein